MALVRERPRLWVRLQPAVGGLILALGAAQLTLLLGFADRLEPRSLLTGGLMLTAGAGMMSRRLAGPRLLAWSAASLGAGVLLVLAVAA